jgi:hypothetical protein
VRAAVAELPVRTRPLTAAGDALLHPLPLAAIALLLLNDHILKSALPGPLTGKLSDVAGLAFFPLALVAGWELVLAAVGGWQGAGRRALVVAVAATGLTFALVKAVPAATTVYAAFLGALQSPLRVLVAGLMGQPDPVPAPVAAVTDPTDLIALPALGAAWLVGRARVRSSERGRWAELSPRG